MKKITTIEEGVESLFLAGQRPSVPFTYEKAGREDRCDSLILDGERYPIFTWRYHPKYYTLRSSLPMLGELSTVKSLDFAPRSRTMAQELFRELDLVEFFLSARIISIMGYGNQQAANFIVRLDNGTVANLEMSVTMPEEANRESKHTIFTTNGMVTDMIADNVIIQQQVHLFNKGKDPVAFTDHDVNLFGLELEAQNICYAIYALIDQREDRNEWRNRIPHLNHLVDEALACLETGKKYQESR